MSRSANERADPVPTMLFHAFLYLAYAALNTAAMGAAKTALSRFDSGQHRFVFGSLALGGALYAAALAVMMLLLKGGEATTVLPIAIGCTVLSTNLAGNHFYGERLSRRKFAGTVLVVVGIALIFLGQQPR